MLQSKTFRFLALLALAPILTGCNAVLLSPSGDIALQQRNLIYISVALMLIVIVPVIFLTLFFAWRYRASNTKATYAPEWNHSTLIELVIWLLPLLIIIALGAVTWVSTHKLDPYRPLERIDAQRALPANVQPLTVQVVALDWKWLFFYPEYGIATVNELAAPVDRPIAFRLTSSSVMNSFFIPALAGQIYTMAGMETQLHAIINKEGVYKGFSANYSGHGFSGMHFEFRGVDPAGFDQWVTDVRGADAQLDRKLYLELEKPTEKVPVTHFAGVENGLYTAIVNMCVELDKMCMSEMMSIDDRGGLGLAGVDNIAPALYGGGTRNRSALGPQKTYVAALCSVDEAIAMTAKLPALSAPKPAMVTGVGLSPPSLLQSPAAAAAMSWLAGQTASLATTSAASTL